RAEINVIGAGARGSESGAERMAGKTDQKIAGRWARSEILVAQSAGLGDGNSVFAQVYASGSASQGHVQPIVHQDSGERAGARDALQGFPPQPRPLFTRVVFFAQLDPVDARGGDVSDAVKEQPVRIGGSRKGQAPAVRYIAKNAPLRVRQGAHGWHSN